MATIDELKAARKNAGLPIEPRVTDVLNTTPGITEELYTNNVLDSLGNTYPWFTQELERTKEPTIPDYEEVIKILDLKDIEGGKTALEQFVEEFPKKQKDWKETFMEKAPKLGEKGWKTVKKVWQQTSNDKMLADIANARKAALNGLNPETGEIEHPLDWMAGKMAGLFTPRRMKAFEEGRDPTALETVMDVAQNAAYAVPMGGVEAAISRGLIKNLAGRAAAATGAAAVAPSAIAALDYGLGTKDYAGAEDAVIDAGIGTATNLGVGRALAPALSKFLNLGLIRSGRIPPSVRKFLEDQQSATQGAKNLVNEAKYKVKAHNAETDAQYFEKLKNGDPTNRLSPEEFQKYSDIIKLDELSKNPEVKKEFTEGWKLGMDMAKNTKGKTYGDIIDFAFLDGAPDYAKRAMLTDNRLANLLLKKGPKDYAKDPGTYSDILKSYLVNEYGDDAAAQLPLATFGMDLKGLRKNQSDMRTKKNAGIAVSKIIDVNRGQLSKESEGFLQDIKNNPNLMVTGYPDQKKNDAFKIWLLTEGNDLLRGTAAARPAWDVK